ncbi:hypothetical protein V2J09_004440 [Rumex salicifolius]
MGRFKAPSPDGSNLFFTNNVGMWWGSRLSDLCWIFLKLESFLLIAKVAKPERISQFRPISLCNILFKTITKTMVNCLKSVIAKLVGPTQASFISRRLSSNNIVIVHVISLIFEKEIFVI